MLALDGKSAKISMIFVVLCFLARDIYEIKLIHAFRVIYRQNLGGILR